MTHDVLKGFACYPGLGKIKKLSFKQQGQKHKTKNMQNSTVSLWVWTNENQVSVAWKGLPKQSVLSSQGDLGVRVAISACSLSTMISNYQQNHVYMYIHIYCIPLEGSCSGLTVCLCICVHAHNRYVRIIIYTYTYKKHIHTDTYMCTLVFIYTYINMTWTWHILKHS